MKIYRVFMDFFLGGRLQNAIREEFFLLFARSLHIPMVRRKMLFAVVSLIA
jgi:hypothetical protein